MKISDWLAKFQSRAANAAGIAVLAGGMMFAGQAVADDVIFEDFESATQTGPGAAGLLGGFGGEWGAYASASDYSGTGGPHTDVVTDGGMFYGHTIGVPANPTATVDFDAEDLGLIVSGARLELEAWMANYTADDDVTTISAELFDGLGGTGNSLGVVSFTDFDDAWSFHTDSILIDAAAVSVTLTYGGVGNDTYADNIRLSVTAIPEPTSFAVLIFAGATVGARRRRI